MEQREGPTALVLTRQPLPQQSRAPGEIEAIRAGRVLGIDRCGASGKAAALFQHFGFTAENVRRNIEELLGA